MTKAQGYQFVAIFGVAFGGCPAFADGGDVLPAHATPNGYSLKRIAVATAVYNTGQMAGNSETPPPPKVPFHILVADTTVERHTLFYLPVFVADDSGGTPPGFPAHIGDQASDAKYLDAVLLSQYNVTHLIVEVDGRTTILHNEYVAGVKTAPLLDGTPGGTHYIVSAAFLSPLSPGEHTVAIGGLVDGMPVAFLSYNVTVR